MLKAAWSQVLLHQERVASPLGKDVLYGVSFCVMTLFSDSSLRKQGAKIEILKG